MLLTNEITIGILILLFYTFSIYALNRVLLFAGNKINPPEAKIKHLKPRLLSANLSFLVGTIISFKTLYTFITYNSLNPFTWRSAFGYSSSVFLYHLAALGLSYVISAIICRYFVRDKSFDLLIYFWPALSCVVYLLLEEFLIQIMGNGAYSIL